MPRLDINGVPLAHYLNFPNDDVSNIEFGAGRNFYGKKEFPNCYITDIKYPEMIPHFSESEEYELGDFHFIDDLCHFYDYNFERKFQKIVFCNPFGYGFLGYGDAKKFFERLDDLLLEDGEVHILCLSCNPWGSKDSFDAYFNNDLFDGVLSELKPKVLFEITDYVEIPRHDPLHINYQFYTSELKRRTYPDQKLIIKRA